MNATIAGRRAWIIYGSAPVHCQGWNACEEEAGPFERAFSSPSEINVLSSGNRLSAGILETHPMRCTQQLSY